VTTFAQFTARKTEEALQADLPSYVTDLDDPPDDVERIGNEWSRTLFHGDFYMSASRSRSRPAANLVFVESLDGNTGARDPGALGGGMTDKHLIYEGLSRLTVDAVLAGAETARGGEMMFSVWRPELIALRSAYGKSRHPIQIVATTRGLDLDRGLLFNSPEIRVILITLSEARQKMRHALAHRPWIQTILIDDPADLVTAFEELASMDVRRLSCVGGRHLAAQLIDANLVSDLYLTTAPNAGGEPNTPLYPRPWPLRREVVRKHGTGVETGVLFRHYTFR